MSKDVVTEFGGLGGCQEISKGVSLLDEVSEGIGVVVTWCLSGTRRLITNYVNVLEMDRPGSAFDGNTMSLFEARFQVEF